MTKLILAVLLSVPQVPSHGILPIEANPAPERPGQRIVKGSVEEISLPRGFPYLVVVLAEDPTVRYWVSADKPNSNVTWNGRKVTGKELTALFISAETPVSFRGVQRNDSFGLITTAQFTSKRGK